MLKSLKKKETIIEVALEIEDAEMVEVVTTLEETEEEEIHHQEVKILIEIITQEGLVEDEVNNRLLIYSDFNS